MKQSNSLRSLSLALTVAATLALAAAPAGAAQTDISQVPLGTASSTSVLPNLMFVLDDSGSMSLHYMPDNVEDNNTCKSYRYTTGGATSTQCMLPTGTDLVSPTRDNVRHFPFLQNAVAPNPGSGNAGTGRWTVGPPAQATEFNTIAYNPQLTYKVGKDRNGADMTSFGSPWTAVQVNPYSTTNTFDLTTQYPEAVFCLNDSDTPLINVGIAPAVVLANNPNCRRNGYAIDGTTLLASFRYSNANAAVDGSYGWPISTASGNFRSVRMRFGGPYYYTILPREHCSDVNLTTCVLSSTPSGANTTPAPVRYCQDSTMANSDAVQSGNSGATARCQAKLDSAHTNMRYGTLVRVDIQPSVATYGGRPNRTDCVARPVCSYAEEMTNFANWHAYYHTRMQTMKTAAGRVFTDMDDRYRIGFVTINATSNARYLKIDKFEPVHKGLWYDKFYAMAPSGGTPLRQALSRVGRHYAGMTDGINSFMPDDPIQFSCQRNFTLLTTDGYWNGAGGVKLDGLAAMDNQDNVTETFVNRQPTGTLDGFGTTVVASNATRTLEQVVCTGNAAGSANFTGTPDTTCGCSVNLKRVKQRTLDATTFTTTVDGIPGTPPPPTSVASFQDITACDATVFTTTWLVTEREDDRCQGNNNTAFTSGSASNAGGNTPCGCTGSNRRIFRRTLTYNRTQQNIDGVAQATVNGTILSQNFAAQTGCVNPAAVSETPVITLGAPSNSAPSGSTITTGNFTITNPTIIPGTTSSSTTPGGFGDTLADVAMFYYKTDLRTAGTVSKNNIKTTTKDLASHQHMVTFTLGLGLDGLMNFQDDYETASTGDFKAITDAATGCSFSGAGTCNWPRPVADAPSALDDLWHAAVNGRGLYFSAKDPNALQTGLTKALAAINTETGSAASSATSTPNLTPTDNFIYSSTYRTVNWDGEIIAERIDIVTGDVQPGNSWPAGTAGQQLNARTTTSTDTRAIFTLDPSDTSRGLKEFRYANLTGPEPAFFDNKCGTIPPSPPAGTSVWPQCGSMSTADLTIANSGNNLVNWLRGQRQYEGNYFRRRDNLLGDTVNSKPAFLTKPSLNYGDSGPPTYLSFKTGPAASRPPVLFISANDGMLHALHGGTVVSGVVTDGGQELWAYVPRMLMPELFKLASTDYDTNHRFYVDGSPVTMDVFLGGAWKTILVGGLNAGGRGYYALDVTDPTPTGVKALWEICADSALCANSDPDIGYSYGQAVITKRPSDGKWVVIISSGYNNTGTLGDGGGWLYVLDAATGAILSKTGTTVAGVNVGDTVTPSGFAKIAGFATNFSVNNTTPTVYGGDLLGNVWRFDLSTNKAAPDDVTVQRLGRAMDGGTPPKPQSITTRPEITHFDAGFNVVYVATGRFIGASDIPDPASFVPPLDLAYQQSVYAIKDTGTDLGILRSPGANLVQQTLILIASSTSRTITNTTVTWSTRNGWFVDLNPANDSPGERVNIDIQLVRGVLLVESNEPNDDACSSGGNSFFYQFDYKSGSYITSAPGGVVGILQGQALAAGFVVYRLPSGQLKYTGIDVTGKKKTGGVNPGSGGSLGKRVSWRELM